VFAGSGSANLAKSLCGTPPYMSPELVRGERYGKPSDVWALGIVLFEMLALCRALRLRTLTQLILRARLMPCLFAVESMCC